MAGVSAAAQRQIADLERDRLWPGAVAHAVANWSTAVHWPGRPYALAAPCPCCDYSLDSERGRALVEFALRVLPTRAARELRAVVTPLDEVYFRRVVPDPRAIFGTEWWVDEP